jgi:hypothetical protein
MATGTSMKGTVIANNAAIKMTTGDTLEGRALSTAGAVSINGIFAYTPVGCGSPTLTGPTAPILTATACYALFSSDGAVTNTGTSFVTGDIGTNVGLTTGFNAVDVTGTIHPIPDGSTGACAADLLTVYNYLNSLSYDIQLLYPAQFGHNLVLTPHTYIMKAASTFTDSIYFNAEGNTNAVFVIQINGALSTSTFSKVLLINGAQAKNVYWLVKGAVSINNNSVFNGTIICNNGAVSTGSGVVLNGRILTTAGNLKPAAINAIGTMIPGNCAALSVQSLDASNSGEAVTIYPNPFKGSATIILNSNSPIDNAQFMLYNELGEEVANTTINNNETILETSKLPSGIYFYRVMNNDILIQSGKLISQK